MIRPKTNVYEGSFDIAIRICHTCGEVGRKFHPNRLKQT